MKDENGRVIGAVAQKPDGTFIKALARKGVILSTGDYSSDEKMLAHFCPYVIDAPRLWTSYDRNVQPSNTGDGHRMGVWAGAKMQDSPHAPMGHHMGGALGASGFLLLNKNGERFVNEDCPGQQINNQVNIQPGKMAWQIADADWADYVPHITPNHGSVCYVMDEDFDAKSNVNHKLGTIDCFTSQAIVDKAIADGSMIKADTLDELMDKLGLPKEKALLEIARYNEMCAQKRDLDFSKQPKRLFPVLKPPFYATKFLPAVMIVCLGGLESDQYCRCYDADGNVIKGLYAAGNVQGDRFSGEYPLTVPGLSHSMALTLGRLAGRYASEEK
ncbi:MAG: FAD-binding protein [Oscillospiraceae bacterium]|nr:FAD-binding protein [Oscillospiraceae bacterium]MDY3064761.1 FAD-binding protein [Oscillospiraceae bacterium]